MRALLAAAVLACALAAVSPAPAATETSPPELPQIWAVDVERQAARALGTQLLGKLRRSGVNALLLDGRSLTTRQKSRLATRAGKRGLLVFVPLRERAPSSWATVLAAGAACRSLKIDDPGRRCTVLASSVVSARRLAEQPAIDVVVVRVRAPRQARALANASGRIVAVPRLRTPARVRPWRRLARLAERKPNFDLAVRVAGDTRQALSLYATVVGKASKGGDRKAPTAPTGLEVETSPTALALTWEPSKDNREVTGYTLYRDGVEVGTTSATSYTFADLRCARSYGLAVDAFDAAGNRSGKSVVAATTAPCSAAVHTTTPAAGASVAGNVRWEAGTEGAGVSEVRFLIDGAHRWTERNEPYVFNGNVGTWDTSKEANGAHTLELVASLEDGTLVGSSIVVTVANGVEQADTTAPAAPPSFVKTGSTTTSISLAWSESSDDVAVAGYRLFRDGALVASTSASTRNHSVPGLTCATTYPFAVEAYDAAGNTSPRTALSASTNLCDSGPTVYALTPADGATVSGSVKWEAEAGGGVAKIEFLVDGVYRWKEENAPYVFNGNDGSWDTTLETNGAHVLTLRLVTTDGATVSASIGVTIANVADTSAPSTPSSLATTGATATSIGLSWSASSDDVGVAGYRVYRDGSPAGTTSGTTYTVFGLSCATTYGLAVEAHDAAGNTSGPAVVSATTAGCPPPSSSTANVFLAPGGSDSNACTAAAPCKSLNRAYQAAALGDVVELADGAYPGEVLEGKHAKSPSLALADRVIFRPAPGAAVETGPLDIRVPHLEFRDMKIAKFKARYYEPDPKLYAAGDLAFRNIRTHHFSLNAVQHVSFVGGEVGPNRNPATGDWPQDGIFIGTYPADVHPASHLLFDGVYVHDVTEPTSTAHSDCIQFTAGIDVTIRNSRFRNCEHADLMIKGDQGPIDGFVIENNFFDRTLSAYYSINLYETSRGCRDVLIRNNTALQNVRLDACPGGTMTGTVQPSMSSNTCSKATVRIDWNVYESGQKCGPNDAVASVSYVDRAAFDLRLAVGSAAIDRGNPGSYPAKDIEGRGRPKGAAPDAGAHEHS